MLINTSLMQVNLHLDRVVDSVVTLNVKDAKKVGDIVRMPQAFESLPMLKKTNGKKEEKADKFYYPIEEFFWLCLTHRHVGPHSVGEHSIDS